MTRLPNTDPARLPLGKRGAFEGVARWPWMASGMGTDDARTPTTNRSRHHAQRVVEKVGRAITNSETPHRWACTKRLRNALATLAHNTRRWNPWAADRYTNARQRGHNHRRALRTLGRAWAPILWRCWQNRTPYDPARHTGLQQHVAVSIPTTSGARPDVPATQPMAGAAVTRRAARRAERAALDGTPPSAIPVGG